MTGNLSRTVLRGAGARESACLPDLIIRRGSEKIWAFFYCLQINR
ncbi:hypothetical protein ABIC37_005524 [Priestia megaterium]